MKSSTLNDLLTVQIKSTTVQSFDPEESIQCWMKTPSGRKRRIVKKSIHVEQNKSRQSLQPIVADEVLVAEVHVDEEAADEVHVEEEVEVADESLVGEEVAEAVDELRETDEGVTPVVNPEEEDESDDEELADSEYDSDKSDCDTEMTEQEVERELELL